MEVYQYGDESIVLILLIFLIVLSQWPPFDSHDR